MCQCHHGTNPVLPFAEPDEYVEEHPHKGKAYRPDGFGCLVLCNGWPYRLWTDYVIIDKSSLINSRYKIFKPAIDKAVHLGCRTRILYLVFGTDFYLVIWTEGHNHWVAPKLIWQQVGNLTRIDRLFKPDNICTAACEVNTSAQSLGWKADYAEYG